MSNIKTELSSTNKIKVTFLGRQASHLRLTNGWIDWMLEMNDFRDLINPLSEKDVDIIVNKLLNCSNKISFICSGNKQEYKISKDKKIIRRLAKGFTRKQYLSVALFVKIGRRKWPPLPIEIKKNEILMLMRAMITLDCPTNRCIVDSVRNYQYLLAILWLKKKNPNLMKGEKKPKADEIFRISLIK